MIYLKTEFIMEEEKAEASHQKFNYCGYVT